MLSQALHPTQPLLVSETTTLSYAIVSTVWEKNVQKETPKGQKDIRVGSRRPEWLVTRKKKPPRRNVQKEAGHSVGGGEWVSSVFLLVLLGGGGWCWLVCAVALSPFSLPCTLRDSTPLICWLYAQRLALFMKNSRTEYPTVVSKEKKKCESILLPLTL